MSKYKLRSHEDLSGYLQSLDDVYTNFQASINSAPCFSGDSETIIEDLLSNFVNAQRKCLDVIKIARKFYKVYENTSQQLRDLEDEKKSLEIEVNECVIKIEAQAKEIETKESRIEIMTIESTEIEKDNKFQSKEIQKLKKEISILKTNLEKPQPQYRSSMIKSPKENEDVKALRELLETNKKEIESKNAEINEFQSKVKELENLYKIEKTSADKIKTINNTLKQENSKLKDQCHEFKFKNSELKDEIESLNNEIIKQKNYVDSLIKGFDDERRRNSSFNVNFNEFYGFDEDNRKSLEEKIAEDKQEDFKVENSFPKYKSKAPKMENLADLMEEDEENEDNEENEEISEVVVSTTKQNGIFILSTSDVSYERKFQFPTPSKFNIESQHKISIIQSGNSGKATFDLSRPKKTKHFRFDYDDKGQETTPVKTAINLITQTFSVTFLPKKLQTISLFKSEPILIPFCHRIFCTENAFCLSIPKKTPPVQDPKAKSQNFVIQSLNSIFLYNYKTPRFEIEFLDTVSISNTVKKLDDTSKSNFSIEFIESISVIKVSNKIQIENKLFNHNSTQSEILLNNNSTQSEVLLFNHNSTQSEIFLLNNNSTQSENLLFNHNSTQSEAFLTFNDGSTQSEDFVSKNPCGIEVFTGFDFFALKKTKNIDLKTINQQMIFINPVKIIKSPTQDVPTSLSHQKSLSCINKTSKSLKISSEILICNINPTKSAKLFPKLVISSETIQVSPLKALTISSMSPRNQIKYELSSSRDPIKDFFLLV